MMTIQPRCRALDLLVVGLVVILGGCVLEWDGPRPGQYTVEAALPDRSVRRDASAERPGRDGGQDRFVADLPLEAAADAEGQDLGDVGPADAVGDAGPADAAWPGSCGNPQAIVLSSSGSATVAGSTAKAINDFGLLINCKSSYNFDGAQVYYQVALTGGKRYLFTLSSPGWNASLYIFKDKSCDSVKINDECSGTDGGFVEKATSTPEQLLFTPKTSGSYIVAVDSYQTQDSGPFTLKIAEAPWPTHMSCAQAQQQSLTGGKATVSGNTLLSKDEHSKLQCDEVGTSYKTLFLYGPQLYYTWAATKDQWYKLTLTPTMWTQYLYTFTSSTCTQAAIAADCRTAGAIAPGTTQALYFKPQVSGPAYFAVDSTVSYGSAFSAAVEQIPTPQNATCATAQPLPLVAGKASVSGDIGPLLTPNEFSGVTCAGWALSYAGPQVYYTVSLKAGQLYFVSLTADTAFGIMAYRFSNTCDPLVIQKDCNAGGAGNSVIDYHVKEGETSHMAFTPATTGTYKIAVDSFNTGSFGGFTLAIEALAKPANDSCQTAAVVTLTAGKAVINGVKAGATSTLAACGTKLLKASDLWYRFTPTPGKKYKVTFKPEGPGGRFVVFDGSHNCATKAVEGACSILGSVFVSAGGSNSLTITGTNTPVYIVADGVNSFYSLYRFTFEIEELP